MIMNQIRNNFFKKYKTFDYIIVGGGCFGLHTAFFLSQVDNYSKILIIDKNTKENATSNSGLGTLKYIPTFNLSKLIEFNKSIDINSIDLSWMPYFSKENMFNMEENREKMVALSNLNAKVLKEYGLINDSNYISCKKTDFYSKDYFKDLKNILQNRRNITFMDDTVLAYKTIYQRNSLLPSSYIIKTEENSYYYCDKLIITTGALVDKLLLKKSLMRGLTKPVSGYSVDLELDNTTQIPECFYLKNNIFITPIDKANRIVRITCKIIFDKEPSSKFITDMDTKEVKNVLKLISSNGIKWNKIISIWRGSRPMTYDSLPFIGEEENGVYVMSGGSFIGTHFSGIFGYWLANIVNYNLNTRYNHKLIDFNIFYSRLTKSRSNTNKNIVLLILSSIALFKLYKKIKNKK